MKLAVCILVVSIAAIVAAEGDAGHFIPRAFYTLDADGHQSELHFVHPNTAHYLRRLRRSSSYTAASSSSSVSASDDGPVLFSSSQTTQQGGDLAAGGGSSASGSTKGSTRTTGADGKTRGHSIETVGMVDKSGRLHSRVTHTRYGSSSGSSKN